MHIGDGIRSALVSIASHKMRSFLTTIGIVIGVIAVVTMFSSVYALKDLINKNMEGMGWNFSVIIAPAGASLGHTNQRSAVETKRRAVQLVNPVDLDDYFALKNELDYKGIYGMVESSSLQRIGNEDNYVTVKATENYFFTNKNYNLDHGRMFSPIEAEEGLPVAILGYKYAEKYFPDSNALGEQLVIGDHRYRVIGVLGSDKLNSSGGMNFNTWERDRELQAVYVPLKYGSYRFTTGKQVHVIYLQAHNAKSFETMKAKARQILLSRHNMYPNFTFMDIGAMMLNISSEIDNQMKKWNITLSAIASISLIVGGIGLFSTLLISIQERMTEIGIRKSIGATEHDIFFYFIFEAIVLALLGAITGILIAWALVSGIGKVLHFPLYLPLSGVLLGLFFSLLIGFISGLFPAIKASRIDPIKAIYYLD
ncbi:MAG: ABC transporter permease [Candidatus Cloacimonetes bacterium]|jgi:putative ABC transport system permease protein|nr:ABC transporter permease [Candidatus Cloacimonadota bacterium]MDD2506794.1 ABC transporter permease [Candidatus Cloacimonadota bacterium]MDD4559548.1 ABC transporter permease [Candidatus Cloacimonadota bacterium]